MHLDLMKETLDTTTLKFIVPGGKVNLERAMRASDRLGGHFVSGHVDTMGTIKAIEEGSNYVEYRISIPKPFLRQVVAKGSITVDGISLTVGKVTETWFLIYFIPHTLEVTTIGRKKVGDKVNIETDLLAKYILKKGRL
jgi:riboflavin synthase